MKTGSTTLFNRKVEVHCLESLRYNAQGELRILRVENVAVRIPGYKNPVDFGSWCYTKHNDFSRESRQRSNYIGLVERTSFRESRRYFVGELISYLGLLNDQSVAPRTLRTIINACRKFVDWCDLEMPHGLDSKDTVNGAFSAYSLHLLELVRLEKLNPNSAAMYQKLILRALISIFSFHGGELTQGVVHLPTLNAARNVTECPSEEDALAALRVSLCLFLQLSDFVIGNKSFPYQLELPDSKYWFFPNQLPFSNAEGREGRSTGQGYLAYDYVSGKIRSGEEISRLLTDRGRGSTRYAGILRKRALRTIRVANSNPYHERRVFAATLAADSFLNLFAANTGMNASNICRIPWDKEYLSAQNTVGFKTLKPRAGNKETEFVISSGFMKHFKKYIKVRKFILEALGESDFPFLFVRLKNGKLTEQTDEFSFNFNRRVNSNFGLRISVTTRQWRALKGDWLIRYTDIATTAMVLQNTVATVLKHYSEGSSSVANEEMTSFFQHYNKHLITESSDTLCELPVGNCKSYGKPSPITDSAAIQSDCTSSEGCIACEHYRVHADRVDLTKLYSFKYVLEVSRHLVHDDSQYQRLISPTNQRLAKIIDAITASGSIEDKDIRDAHDAVFEREELSPYWSKKLDLLTRVEVL